MNCKTIFLASPINDQLNAYQDAVSVKSVAFLIYTALQHNHCYFLYFQNRSLPSAIHSTASSILFWRVASVLAVVIQVM